MLKAARDQTVRMLVKMEERIAKCARCKEEYFCYSRPAIGRGDVEADIMVVFLCEDEYCADRNNIINMREEIKAVAGGQVKLYHSYLVRCVRRSCYRLKGKESLFNGRLLKKDGTCLLSGQPCSGVIESPKDGEIMNCFYFLLEEIEILKPKVIIPVGETTCNYLFKAYGLFDPCKKGFASVKNHLFSTSKHFFIPVEQPGENRAFSWQDVADSLRSALLGVQ